MVLSYSMLLIPKIQIGRYGLIQKDGNPRIYAFSENITKHVKYTIWVFSIPILRF